MSEAVVADRWLASVLAAATASVAPGGVHSDVAPPGTVGPWVTFGLQDARDVKVVNTARVLTDATYLVKAVGPGSSYAGLEEVADAIDTALSGAAAVVAQGAIIWCERERPVRYRESDNGIEYRHLGGLYRIQVREE